MEAGLTEAEQCLLAADERSTARTGIWLVVMIGCLLGGVAIAAFGAAVWLKTGVWPDLSIRAAMAWFGFVLPSITWIGVQRIIEWTLSCPLWMVCEGAGVIAVILFTRHDANESEALRVARMKRAQGISVRHATIIKTPSASD